MNWPLLCCITLFFMRPAVAGLEIIPEEESELSKELKRYDKNGNEKIKFGKAEDCPSPSKTDTNYFEDISDLTAHMHSAEDPSLPKHKRTFCRGLPRNIADRLLNDIGYNVYDTLAFKNPPGPIGKGMCWLHSRLQRQFTYLANYRPELPKPSREDALEIINRIVHRKGVTEIPGFRNLYEFSKAYEKELTSAIDGMGLRCVANPTDCPARLGDSYSPTAQDLQGTMDQLYKKQLQNYGDIQMVRSRLLDSSGITAPFVSHSLLILGMEPIRKEVPVGHTLPGNKTGYRLMVIDPNFPDRIEKVDYHYGDTELKAGEARIAPYPHYEYDKDPQDMHKHIDKYCKK